MTIDDCKLQIAQDNNFSKWDLVYFVATESVDLVNKMINDTILLYHKTQVNL
jgi:hypothetical protein